ncbi:MAG: glycosyltransferase involved in cell wall biosynthesis, partial [Candidatus Krumholzibacteriia bacterium]
RTWGGAEVWMLETAQALVQRGHAVEFVVNPDSEMRERASSAGLPVTPLSIRCDGAFWTIAALAWHLRRRGVTSLIANCTKDVTIAAPAGRLAGLKSILATRESDFPLRDRFDYRWNFNTLCTGILVNSMATKNTIVSSVPWLDESKIHLLYKGIDTDFYHPLDAPTGPPVVGFVGQMIRRKGLAAIMEAWSLIDRQAHTPRPVLRLAGVGEMTPEIEAWRGQLAHPDAVELHGYVEDMAAFYQGLLVLLMPSHAEGFGLAAAEAMACAIPVIAGDASSLPELISHGETGLLVKPGDSEALLKALEKTLADHSLARRMGAAGREAVCTKFPQEKSLTRLLKLTGHSTATHSK